jgi:hypothetical protein
MKKWGKITADVDLRQHTKDAKDNIFVGVTQSGKMYIIDSTSKAKEISVADAAKYLEVSPDVVAEIVKSRGSYDMPVAPTKSLVDGDFNKLPYETPKIEVLVVEPNPVEVHEEAATQDVKDLSKGDRLIELLRQREAIDEEIRILIL